MEFSAYAARARETAIYPNQGNNIHYPALGLGEVGEIQGKIKKVYRDHGGVFTEELQAPIRAELGDLLWYLAVMAVEAGINPDIYDYMPFEVKAPPVERVSEIALKLGADIGRVQALAVTYHQDEYVTRMAMRQMIRRALTEVWKLAGALDCTVGELMEANLQKLASRAERGTLAGSGDDR